MMNALRETKRKKYSFDFWIEIWDLLQPHIAHNTTTVAYPSSHKYIPVHTQPNIMSPIGSVLLAPSPSSGAKYDLTYYLKAAAAGGICCSITHGALTPVDGTFDLLSDQDSFPYQPPCC